MDLQTYIIWKYGTGFNLKPSTMYQLLKLSKSINDYKSKLIKYDHLASKLF